MNCNTKHETIKNYAIFGGSFDPVHLGHIRLAKAAVKLKKLDRLYFVPNHISPFKTENTITSGDKRYDIIQSILHYCKEFAVSRYEIDKPVPSYTYDTLSHFDKIFCGEMYFLLGFDSLFEIESWYKGEYILSHYKLITAVRPDTNTSSVMKKIDIYRRKYEAQIEILEIPPFRASSTDIRNKVHRGESITGLVAPETEEYILKEGLYL